MDPERDGLGMAVADGSGETETTDVQPASAARIDPVTMRAT
jgi:hypothetical protein